MGPEVTEKGGPHDRARIVRRYLSALDAQKPGRTAARTVESVLHRIHQIDTLLLSADPVQRLHLTQERIDLHAEQLRLQTASGSDFDELQKAFIRVARAYGDRHDVTYSAWRQVGVDAEVLAKAGIHPAAKPARPGAPAKAEAPAAKPNAPKTDAPKPEAAKPEAAKANAPKPNAPKSNAPTPNAPKSDAATPAASTPAEAPAPAAEEKPAPAPKVEKKAAPKKAAEPKPAAAKKDAGSPQNGGAAKSTAKKAKKASAPQPEQQQLPAEAHLLS